MKKYFLFLLMVFSLTGKANPWPIFPWNLFSLYSTPLILFGDNYPLDADGALIISHSRFRVVGSADFNMYSIHGEFFSQTGDTSSKHNIGDVEINDSISPIFSKDSTYKIFGMDFSQDTAFTWKFFPQGVNNIVQVPAVFTTTKPLFNINSINLANVDTNVYRGQGFSFSHSIIAADSVVYIFSSDTFKIQKSVIGPSSSIIFTPAEMLSLPQSDNGGFFMIIYNVMPATFNGKKYYFQNNSSAIVGTLHVY